MEKILKTLDVLKVPTFISSDTNIPGTISSSVVAAGDSVKTKYDDLTVCIALTYGCNEPLTNVICKMHF